MTLIVQIRQVYGADTVYPACEKSQAFLKALGYKTFTPSLISAVKALGYTITTKQEARTL